MVFLTDATSTRDYQKCCGEKIFCESHIVNNRRVSLKCNYRFEQQPHVTLSVSCHCMRYNAIQHSPYVLYECDAMHMRPRGQIVLLCEREGRYETLIFQVLPNELMGDKPALLSGTDSERPSLISINTGEVFLINSTRVVTETTG